MKKDHSPFTVALTAKGYFWFCPECGIENEEEELADEVECCNCGITYKTSEPCL